MLFPATFLHLHLDPIDDAVSDSLHVGHIKARDRAPSPCIITRPPKTASADHPDNNMGDEAFAYTLARSADAGEEQAI